MSIIDSISSVCVAPLLSGIVGEPVTIAPKGGAPVRANATIFRNPLETRREDNNSRIEYSISVLVAMADYPVASPNIGGDTIALLVRKGDTVPATKKVSSIISQIGGMWHLRLD